MGTIRWVLPGRWPGAGCCIGLHHDAASGPEPGRPGAAVCPAVP